MIYNTNKSGVNMIKVLFGSCFVLVVFLSTGCATAHNRGVAIKEGAIEPGQQFGNNAEDIGLRLQDASISSAIKLKFANDELISASDINVDTTNGFVTLRGTVGSKAKADRAMKLGRSTDGVKSVHSHLFVRSGRN
jgi:hyperosmotically inducible periplasmic protein